MNYRSVCVFGRSRRVTGAKARSAALEALVEHLVPGRSGDARSPNATELAATELVEVPLEEASAKIRTGPPVDDEADVDLPVWAGVLPAVIAWGAPRGPAGVRPRVQAARNAARSLVGAAGARLRGFHDLSARSPGAPARRERPVCI